MSKPFSGKFTTHCLPTYDTHERRILYVGKATAGVFDEEDASARFFNGNGPFWGFARTISKCADPACDDLSTSADGPPTIIPRNLGAPFIAALSR